MAEWRSHNIKDFIPNKPILFLLEEQIAVIHHRNGYLMVAILSSDLMKVEKEIILKEDWAHWGCHVPIDYSLLHNKVYMLLGRVIVLRYTTATDPFHLLVLDIGRKSIEPAQVVVEEGRAFRAKFGSSMYKNLIYLFGGVGLDLQLFSDLEVIDIHKMELSKISPKGKSPSPRYSPALEFHNGKLLVAGGTTGTDIFVPEPFLSDLYMYDPQVNSWYSIEIPTLCSTSLGILNIFTHSPGHLIFLCTSASSSCCLSLLLYSPGTSSLSQQWQVLESRESVLRYESSQLYLSPSSELVSMGGVHFERKKQPFCSNRCDVWKIHPEQKTHLKTQVKETEVDREKQGIEYDEDDDLTFEELLLKEKKNRSKIFGNDN